MITHSDLFTTTINHAPCAFTLLQSARRSSAVISLSCRLWKAGRMSRSTMLLRITLVLSATFTVNLIRLLAIVTDR